MSLVFDTEPLLDRVADGRERGYIRRVTLAELAYHLRRRREAAADAALHELVADGVSPVPCEPAWSEAARLKARYALLSIADAFGAATARALGAEFVVLRDEAILRACAAEGIRTRPL